MHGSRQFQIDKNKNAFKINKEERQYDQLIKLPSDILMTLPIYNIHVLLFINNDIAVYLLCI